MTLLDAIYLLIEVATFGFVVWLLVTFLAKVSPAREIVLGLAALLLVLFLLHQFGYLLEHEPARHRLP